MALTREQSINLYGSDRYTGWGETEAAANAKALGLNSQSGTSGSLYGSQLGQLDAKLDEYINDLISQANGDRAFIAKQLDAQHQLALGNDDKATAEFLEKVSDKLEQKIGRIPYDYEKFTARELEDYALSKTRTDTDLKTALYRLSEDEKVLQKGLDAESLIARRNQESELNRRGVIQGTRENAVGLAGKEVGLLEGNIDERQSALARAIGRDRDDITRTGERSLADLSRTSGRTFEDLKTSARRESLDTQQNIAFGKEAADKEFERRKKLLEQERTLGQLGNTSYALTGSA